MFGVLELNDQNLCDFHMRFFKPPPHFNCFIISDVKIQGLFGFCCDIILGNVRLLRESEKRRNKSEMSEVPLHLAKPQE